MKDYFLNTVHLLRIHRYDPQNSKFDDALVSSCVVWFKNEASPENYDVELSFGGTHEEPDVVKKIDKITLQSRRKWTVLVQNKSNYQGESEPVLGISLELNEALLQVIMIFSFYLRSKLKHWVSNLSFLFRFYLVHDF